MSMLSTVCIMGKLVSTIKDNQILPSKGVSVLVCSLFTTHYQSEFPRISTLQTNLLNVCHTRHYTQQLAQHILKHFKGLQLFRKGDFISDEFNSWLYCYQQQRSWAKVMFLQLSVMLSTGGSASVHAGIPPLKSRQPPRNRHPLKKQTPPQEADTPKKQTPPKKQTLIPHPHPTSGWYASYWNAYLFLNAIKG